MTRLLFGLFLTTFAVAHAVATPAQNVSWRDNEDLRYIWNWEQEQRTQKLAQILNLSPEQVDALRAMRTEIDRIKAEMKPQVEALETAMETKAGALRHTLELGGTLSDADREDLRQLRRDFRGLKREERFRIGLATLDLIGLLHEDQKRALQEHTATRSAALRDKWNRAGRRSGKARSPRGVRAARGLARVLLSETFLAQFPQSVNWRNAWSCMADLG